MQPKFNVGDTVKIVAGGYGTHPDDVGKTTTIVGIKRTGYSIGYVYDTTGLYIDGMPWISNHRYTADSADAFVKVQPQPKEQKMEFKVGQKVRVTSSAGNNFSVGDIVTVERKAFTTGSMILRGVITNRRDSRYGTVDTQCLNLSQFEAVDEPKVGDKVRINNNSRIFHYLKVGSIGKITEVSGTTGDGKRLYRIEGTSSSNGRTITQSLVAEQFEFVSRLDLTKPVFTVEGTPVTIVTTEGRDKDFPVLAYEGKATQLSKFSLQGEHKHGPARRNLTNDEYKPLEKTVKVSLYADGSVSVATEGDTPATMNGKAKVDTKVVTLKEAN